MEHKKKRLTITQLKSFAGYENITEIESENIIASLEKISIVFYELYQKKKRESEQVNNSNSKIDFNNDLNTDNNYGRKRNAA